MLYTGCKVCRFQVFCLTFCITLPSPIRFVLLAQTRMMNQRNFRVQLSPTTAGAPTTVPTAIYRGSLDCLLQVRPRDAVKDSGMLSENQGWCQRFESVVKDSGTLFGNVFSLYRQYKFILVNAPSNTYMFIFIVESFCSDVLI